MGFLRSLVSDAGRNALLEFTADRKMVNHWIDFDDNATVRQKIHEIEKRNNTVYFALGAYNPDAQLTRGVGRTQANVVALRSLWLDIDAGPVKTSKLNGHAKDSVYADAGEALEGLRDALQQTGILKPTHVVSSGFGLHVYWAFTRDLPPAVWKKLSDEVVSRLTAAGLKVDKHRVGDTASILRPISTRHHEASEYEGEDIYVQLLRDEAPVEPDDLYLSALNSPVKPAVVVRGGSRPAPVSKPIKKFDGKGSSLLSKITAERIEASNKRADLDVPPDTEANRDLLWELLEAVPSDMSRDGGWMQVIFALRHLFDGGWDGDWLLDTLVEWSAENASDDKYEDEIYKIWNSAERGYSGKGVRIGSLIHMARENGLPDSWRFIDGDEEPNTPKILPVSKGEVTLNFVTPTLPAGFFRRTGKPGLWVKTGDDDDGDDNWACFFSHELYVIDRGVSSEGRESLTLMLLRPHDRPKQIQLPLSQLAVAAEMKKALSDHGVLVNYGDKGWSIMSRYLTAQAQDFVASKQATHQVDNFGWKTDGSFVIGTMRVRKDGELEPIIPSDDIKGYAEDLYPQGSVEDWAKIPQLYNYDGLEFAQFVILLSMGAPLYIHTGFTGGTCHVYSQDGGYGKTTVMRVATSVWGNPGGGAKGHASSLMSNDGTGNSLFVRMSHMGSLPCMLDEVTHAESGIGAKDFRNFVLRNTSGKQRDRMVSGRNALRVNTTTWTTFAITSANRSIESYLTDTKQMSSTAERRRVIDLSFRSLGQLTEKLYPFAHASEILTETLPYNYGAVGIELLRNYVTNFDDMRERVRAQQQEFATSITDAKVRAESNIQIAMLSVAMVARDVAEEMGIITFNRERLHQFCLRILNTQVQSAKQQALTPEETFSEFLRQTASRVVHTQRGRGIGVALVGNLPRDAVAGRWDISEGKLSIVRNELRSFCSESRIDVSLVEDWLRKSGALDDDNARVMIGRGIAGLNIGQLRCYVIDTHKAGLEPPEPTKEETE